MGDNMDIMLILAKELLAQGKEDKTTREEPVLSDFKVKNSSLRARSFQMSPHSTELEFTQVEISEDSEGGGRVIRGKKYLLYISTANSDCVVR